MKKLSSKACSLISFLFLFILFVLFIGELSTLDILLGFACIIAIIYFIILAMKKAVQEKKTAKKEEEERAKAIKERIENTPSYKLNDIEIVGTEYYSSGAIKKGASVIFAAQPENEHDNRAVAVFSNEKQIGYIAKEHSCKDMIFDALQANCRIEGVIDFVDEESVQADVKIFGCFDLNYNHIKWDLEPDLVFNLKCDESAECFKLYDEIELCSDYDDKDREIYTLEIGKYISKKCPDSVVELADASNTLHLFITDVKELEEGTKIKIEAFSF